MARKLQLLGRKFSRLTVVEERPSKNNLSMWLCVCDCGNTVIVAGKSLVSANTKSCGCLKRDTTSERNKRQKPTHHETFTRLYKIWHSMKCRCRQKRFKNYCGKGISVCKEWDTSYKEFRNWSLSNGYRDGLSIDRIDNSGNYCPSNCRWVTEKEQARNKTTNRIILGKPLVEWSEITGLSRSAIAHRIDELGWDEERAVNTPCRRFRKNKE